MKPIATDIKRPKAVAKGRPIDLIATGLAGLSTLLASIFTLLFFSGFVTNDPTLGKALSAVIFSIFLGGFAIIPAMLISVIAFRGWKHGLSTKGALWAFGLSLPWVILSVLIFLKTPIPTYISFTAISLSFCLWLWASLSLVLIFAKFRTASRKSDIA